MLALFFNIPGLMNQAGHAFLAKNAFAQKTDVDMQSYIDQGNAYLERGDYSSAFSQYREAEKFCPDSIYIHEALHITSRGMWNNELAKEEFRKVLKLRKQKTYPRSEYFYFFSFILILLFFLITRLMLKRASLDKFFHRLSSFKITNITLLILLIILLLVSRIPSLVSVMLLPYREAAYRASIAKDIIEGLKTNIFNYQYAGYNGGMLMIGFLAVPFLFLFGDTFSSFALLPLLFSVGILLLIYRLLLKSFGKNAAMVTSFLFIALVPVVFIERSMLAAGDHIESVFFVLVLLSIFYKIFFDKEFNLSYYGIRNDPYLKKKLYLLFILAGIISGLALYACYSFLIALFTVFLFWFVFDKRFLFKRYFLFFLISFLIGFSPWFLYNVPRHWEGVYLPGLRIAYIPPAPTASYLRVPIGPPVKYSELNRPSIFDVFPKSIDIRKLRRSLEIFNIEMQTLFFNTKDNFIPIDLVYNIIVFVFFMVLVINLKLIGKFIISLFSLREIKENNPEIYRETIALFLATFYILAYIFHPMEWPKIQYLFPILPFLFILVGISIEKIYNLKILFPIGPILGIFVTASLIFAGVFNYQDLANYRPKSNIRISDIFKLKAYSLVGLDDFLPCPNSIYMLDFYHSGALYTKYDLFTNFRLCDKFASSKFSIDKKYYYIEHEKPEIRYPFYLLCGINIGDGICKISNKDYNILIRRYIFSPYRHCIYEGIALSFTNRFFKELSGAFKSGLVAGNIPREYQHYFYTEFGRRIGEKYKGDLRQGSRLIESFEDEYRAYLYRGFSSFFRGQSIREICNNEIRVIDKRYRGDFYSQWGAVASRDYYDGVLDNKSLNVLIEQLPDEYKPFFIMGLAREYYNFSKNNFQKDFMVELKEGMELFSDFAADKRYAQFIYEGLGCGLSLRTYGQLKGYIISINELVPLEYVDSFYRGCGAGLSLRYGQDKEEIHRIISEEIPSKYQRSSYEGAKEY